MASDDGNSVRLQSENSEEEEVYNDANESSAVDESDMGDQEPLKENASIAEQRAFSAAVATYSTEMLDVFKECNVTGKEFWLDFTSTFREHSICAMPKAIQVKWVHLLIERGVHIKRKQGFPRSKALIDCLQRNTYVPTNVENENGLTTVHSKCTNSGNERTRLTYIPNSEPQDLRKESVNAKNCSNDATKAFQKNVEQYPGYNLDLTNRASIEPKNPSGDIITNNNAPPEKKDFSLGISGLMKAYHGRKHYSGALDEDLQGSLELYETMCRVCRLSDDEKAQGMPVMLKDDALSFYMSVFKPGNTYENISQQLIDNYMSAEQQNRTLILWQSMRLSSSMRDERNKSELEVFGFLCHKLLQLQRQLDPVYRHDQFLRDQLVIAADTPQNWTVHARTCSKYVTRC